MLVTSCWAHLQIHPHVYPSNIYHVAYVPNSVDILLSGTYFTITCEADAAGNCVVIYISKHVGSICSYSIFVVLPIFVLWQPYFSRDVSNTCAVVLVTWLIAITSYVVYMYIQRLYKDIKYLGHMAYMSNCVEIFLLYICQ